MSISPTHQKGNLSQLKIITKLVELGQHVSVPVGDGSRYDFIVEVNGRLVTVQCKTAKLLPNDSLSYRTVSYSSSKTKNYSRNYRGQVDLFGIYCNELDSIYLTPVAKAPSKLGTLRLKPAKRNQNKHIVYAKNFELTDIDSLVRLIDTLP